MIPGEAAEVDIDSGSGERGENGRDEEVGGGSRKGRRCFIGFGLSRTRGGHAINEHHASSNQRTLIVKRVFEQTMTSKTRNTYTVSLN